MMPGATVATGSVDIESSTEVSLSDSFVISVSCTIRSNFLNQYI